MKAADVEAAVDSVFGLLDKWGHENYIGEQVTQLQHAQQVGAVLEVLGDLENAHLVYPSTFS